MTIRFIRRINISGGVALGIAWNEPSHDRRLGIEYRLQYREGQDQWSSSIRTMYQNHVIPNLSHLTTYQVCVKGVSVAGMHGLFGEWSDHYESSTNLSGIVIFHYNIVH